MKIQSVFMFFLASLILTQPSFAMDLKVGDKAPQASALNHEGKKVNLNDHYKKGLVMVYFYPKADTPGCTAQACSLRDSFEELTKKGVAVFGVSTDSVESQKKFKEKYSLPFTLLSDEDKKVANAFGVPVTMGFTSRQSFIIKDGKVAWIDRKASTKEQAADVLKFIGQ